MAGEFVQFDNLVFEPKPVSKPHPPIWIGGESGPAIRRAARLGDGWFPSNHNPSNMLDTPERYAQSVARLEQAAAQHDRDPSEIHRAYLSFRPINIRKQLDSDGNRHCLTGPADAIRNDIGAFAEEGVETMIFFVAGAELNEILDGIAQLAEDVLP